MFSRIKVPQGYSVELAVDISYIGSHLMEDANYGWVRVFHVAQLMKNAAGFLQDIYDTHRLRALSPRCIRCLRQGDISFVVTLCNRRNEE